MQPIFKCFFLDLQHLRAKSLFYNILGPGISFWTFLKMSILKNLADFFSNFLREEYKEPENNYYTNNYTNMHLYK